MFAVPDCERGHLATFRVYNNSGAEAVFADMDTFSNMFDRVCRSSEDTAFSSRKELVISEKEHTLAENSVISRRYLDSIAALLLQNSTLLLPAGCSYSFQNPDDFQSENDLVF